MTDRACAPFARLAAGGGKLQLFRCKGLEISLLVAGGLLIFLALRWPQWLIGMLLKGINAVFEKSRSDQNAATAIRLCRAAVATISGLPIRETGI